jgi:hypothetical protein
VFVDGLTGESVTFAVLHEQVLRIAAALAERGIGHGELRTDRERGSGLPSTADPSLEAVTARLRPVRGLA